MAAQDSSPDTARALDTAPRQVAPPPPPRRGLFELDPLSRRRWASFKANKRGLWSFRLFLVLFAIALCAPLVANDKPLWLTYGARPSSPSAVPPRDPLQRRFRDRGRLPLRRGPLSHRHRRARRLLRRPRRPHRPDLHRRDPARRCPRLHGLAPDPLQLRHHQLRRAPRPLAARRHELARHRRSGPRRPRPRHLRLRHLRALRPRPDRPLRPHRRLRGAAQGYFGAGWDLVFQRIEEIWSAIPVLFLIMIISAIITPTFWSMLILLSLFQWTALVGVVRAEFLRAATSNTSAPPARSGSATGPSCSATSCPTPWWRPSPCSPSSSPPPSRRWRPSTSSASASRLLPLARDLALQGKNNLQAPWLGFTAFFTFAIMLSLLVFIFEAVRDAFDPRKTFG